MLRDAVYHEPWKVKSLITDNPAMLEATNLSAETVIHWMIVENEIDHVRLLFECGADIPSYAIAEACSLGSLDMVDLLLCFGAKPDVNSCRVNLRLGNLGRKTTVRMREVFRRHGYPLLDTSFESK